MAFFVFALYLALGPADVDNARRESSGTDSNPPAGDREEVKTEPTSRDPEIGVEHIHDALTDGTLVKTEGNGTNEEVSSADVTETTEHSSPRTKQIFPKRKKSFNCDQCGRRFLLSSLLKQHK